MFGEIFTTGDMVRMIIVLVIVAALAIAGAFLFVRHVIFPIFSYRYNSKEKIARLCFCLALFCACAYFPLKWRYFPTDGIAVDTRDWKTHCLGFFLINLPPDAEVRIAPVVMPGHFTQPKEYALALRRDLTPESALREAEAAAFKWKYRAHEKNGGAMLINSLPLPNGGLAVHRWEYEYSTSDQILNCWVVTDDIPPRVFTFASSPFSAEHADKEVEKTLRFAAGLRARDEHDPLPTEPGFCFADGFSAYADAFLPGNLELCVYLPRYPDIVLRFTQEQTYRLRPLLERESLFESVSSAFFERDIRRGGESTMGDFVAQEYCAISRNRYGEIRISFTLETVVAQGLPAERLLRLSLDERNPFTERNAPDFPHSATARRAGPSSKELLGLWDAARRSIRLRPGAVPPASETRTGYIPQTKTLPSNTIYLPRK